MVSAVFSIFIYFPVAHCTSVPCFGKKVVGKIVDGDKNYKENAPGLGSDFFLRYPLCPRHPSDTNPTLTQ